MLNGVRGQKEKRGGWGGKGEAESGDVARSESVGQLTYNQLHVSDN